MMGNGTMQGMLNGNAMTFPMTIPTGGFNGSMSPCSMSMDGRADISAEGMTMTGTYGGQMSGMMSGMMSQQQSCGGVMTNGQFTMSRQRVSSASGARDGNLIGVQIPSSAPTQSSTF